MAAHRKVRLPDGKDYDSVVVEFEPEKESFSIYLLEDGTTLKVKAVLTEVSRVEGAYLPNGDPLYAIQAAQILSAVAPEHLRKKE
ncbi:MAG: hypothetical protein ACRD2H_01685 [Terriglobales bacterium]